MAEKKKLDFLSGSPWYALTEEEMAAAGWPQQEEKEKTKPAEESAPKGPTNPSTVVKSPWDVTRERVDETVEEQLEEDLSYWLGNTDREGKTQSRPLPKSLTGSCLGLLFGAVLGILLGHTFVISALGLVIGLALGLLAKRA